MYLNDKGYRDLIWIDSAGAAHALDTAGFVAEPARAREDGSSTESRSGFFLDPAIRPDGCRLAITHGNYLAWPTGKDTVRAGGVRLQGYREGNYPPWQPDDACGRAEFPDGVAWIIRTRLETFPDVEGSKHGRDETYRLGIRWGREGMEGIYHTRSWTELLP
jgi:hypothetical protein